MKSTAKKTNPNGANQYLLDPRQKLCWEYYVSPKSETFGNAYQSAVKAGYEKTTSTQITMETWFLERVRRLNLLGKAEKVLDEALGVSHLDDEGKIDSSVLKAKLDAAKFVASTQGKSEGYTTKVEQEHSNPDGNLKTIIINKYGSNNQPTA